jgi:hypothetical protein
MDDFQWIRDTIPHSIHVGVKFLVDTNSGPLVDDDTVIVIEITKVCDSEVKTYTTSNKSRYHRKHSGKVRDHIQSLINTHYWQPYDGEHIFTISEHEENHIGRDGWVGLD